MEILVALMLIGFVFVMATSVYTTGLKMLKTQRDAAMISTPPTIALEAMTKKITVALDLTRRLANGTVESTVGDSEQINIRVDETDCSGTANVPPTPDEITDDSYYHYAFKNGALRFGCRSQAVDPNGVYEVLDGDASLIDTLDTQGDLCAAPPAGRSCFSLTNPTAIGTPTVARIYVISTPLNLPVQTLQTSVAAQGKTKR